MESSQSTIGLIGGIPITSLWTTGSIILGASISAVFAFALQRRLLNQQASKEALKQKEEDELTILAIGLKIRDLCIASTIVKEEFHKRLASFELLDVSINEISGQYELVKEYAPMPENPSFRGKDGISLSDVTPVIRNGSYKLALDLSNALYVHRSVCDEFRELKRLRDEALEIVSKVYSGAGEIGEPEVAKISVDAYKSLFETYAAIAEENLIWMKKRRELFLEFARGHLSERAISQLNEVMEN